MNKKTHFFGDFDDLFEIEFWRDALYGGKGFTTIPLLDPDVDVAVLTSPSLFVQFGIRKWIYGVSKAKDK